MILKSELNIESQSILDRLSKKGDFYFHIAFVIIFSVSTILTDKVNSMGWTIALIALAILTLPFYTFFVHRYYIYSMTLDADNLIIEYKKWFKTKKAQISLDKLRIENKTQYKINFETLVIHDDNIKITQSIQGDWSTELMNKMYIRLLELKKRNTNN